jgi:uncharacterized membrane protein YbhN (UPF0104 family)
VKASWAPSGDQAGRCLRSPSVVSRTGGSAEQVATKNTKITKKEAACTSTTRVAFIALCISLSCLFVLFVAMLNQFLNQTSPSRIGGSAEQVATRNRKSTKQEATCTTRVSFVALCISLSCLFVLFVAIRFVPFRGHLNQFLNHLA